MSCNITIDCCNGENCVQTVNGIPGPDVLLGLEEILAQGNNTTNSITTTNIIEANRFYINNTTAVTRVLTQATAGQTVEFPDASGVVLLNTSPLKADMLVWQMHVSANFNEALSPSEHWIFTGPITSLWTLPSPVGLYGKCIAVTNQSLGSTLGIDVLGGGNDIFAFGAPSPSVNLIPYQTSHFKSDGNFWYPC